MLMVRDTNTRTGTHMYMDKARVSQDICMGWPIRVWAKYLHGTEHDNLNEHCKAEFACLVI